KPRLRTNYLFYVEDLTPAELGRVLGRLGGPEDTQFDRKRPAAGQFAGSDYNVVLTRMTADHRKVLSAYLGADPRQVKALPAGPLGVDLRKPLSEQTADQVVGALASGRSAGR